MFCSDKYFCIPDIHGRNDLLQMALKYVYETYPDGCEIIFLGDYIDRGTENLKVLRTVMNPPEKYKFTCLLGNHEDMFVKSYLSENIFYHMATAKEIAGVEESVYDLDRILSGIDKNIIKWMESLPFFYNKGKNMFAHAFYDDNLQPYDQRRSNCVWDRIPDDRYYNDNQGFFLTHGHTPRDYGPIFGMNKINLDTGAVFTGRLVMAEYAIGRTRPVDIHEFII